MTNSPPCPPPDARHRLSVLISQIRPCQPENGQKAGEMAVKEEDAAPPVHVGGRDLDDHGKASSSVAFSESTAPLPAIPRNFLPKRSAVLICLFEDEKGDIRVILTQRSSNISSHSGDVSLPGGKVEAGDADDHATALREAKEEIGLDPSLVTVVEILEPFLSRVVPVIGMISNKQAFTPVLNAAEVETIFDAPLEMFLKDENHRSEEREWMGEKFVVHFFYYETSQKKFLIWGLTAAILIQAASVIYQQKPSFSKMKQNYKYYTNIKG